VALRYVLDENLRGPLWWAFQGHNAAGVNPVDVVRVGDLADLPGGTPDPTLLVWAEREGRILISVDWSTLPVHFAAHLANGSHSAGLILLRSNVPIQDLVEELVLIAHAGDAADYQDQIRVVP
jgi:hypothetical protein